MISKDGRNIKNIKARVNKGKGIVQNIMNVLDGVPFGKLYFQVAMLLRNSLLVSSLLCNSEAWFNLTKSDLDLLETVDLLLIRSIMKAPKSTSKEMFFLELGILPLRELIKKRRLTFLHYILNQEADSLIFKVLEKQCESRTAKDWVTTVITDLETLGLNVTFGDIQKMSKVKWKSIVKIKVKEESLKNLEKMKKAHSKVKEIEHKKLEMQTYFLPNQNKISQEEIKIIFKMRCREMKVKMNLKGAYDTFECEVCQDEDETQEHVYNCKEIWKLKEYDNENIPEYEKILHGSVKEQIAVAIIFEENMKIKENLLYQK